MKILDISIFMHNTSHVFYGSAGLIRIVMLGEKLPCDSGTVSYNEHWYSQVREKLVKVSDF